MQILPCVPLLIVLGLSASTSPQSPSDVERAEALFKKGHFAEAEAIYAALAAGKSSADYTVVLNLGRLALISNRLKQAQQWLEKAVQSQANSKEAKSLLAEALC